MLIQVDLLLSHNDVTIISRYLLFIVPSFKISNTFTLNVSLDFPA